MSKKPPVGNAIWQIEFDEIINGRMQFEKEYKTRHFRVYLDTNRKNNPYGLLCFYKVAITGLRPKYFYGEVAYSDVERYVDDMGGLWGCLSGR